MLKYASISDFRRKRSVSFLSVAPKRRLREILTKRLSVSFLGVAAKRHFRGISTMRTSVSILGVAAKRHLRAIFNQAAVCSFSRKSLQTTRLFVISCTVRHAISKTFAGRSNFEIRVGTYNSCLKPTILRSQLLSRPKLHPRKSCTEIRPLVGFASKPSLEGSRRIALAQHLISERVQQDL